MCELLQLLISFKVCLALTGLLAALAVTIQTIYEKYEKAQLKWEYEQDIKKMCQDFEQNNSQR